MGFSSNDNRSTDGHQIINTARDRYAGDASPIRDHPYIGGGQELDKLLLRHGTHYSDIVELFAGCQFVQLVPAYAPSGKKEVNVLFRLQQFGSLEHRRRRVGEAKVARQANDELRIQPRAELVPRIDLSVSNREQHPVGNELDLVRRNPLVSGE